MPGPTPVNGLAVPKLVPVASEPVYQVKVAPVPVTPLAVMDVVVPGHIGLAAEVADVIPTFVFDPTTIDACAGAPHVPVT